MQNVQFYAYGFDFKGTISDAYKWAIPLLKASIEIKKGVPVCPKFHCGGLKNEDVTITAKGLRAEQYKLEVTDTGTHFVPA